MMKLMKYTFIPTLLVGLMLLSNPAKGFSPTESAIVLHEDLEIKRIKLDLFIHTSYLKLDDGSKFPCNGMIYIAEGKALVFDTPVNNELSNILISWLADTLGLKVDGVIINHFHNDCLGGLEAFHNRKVPSFALNRTIELAKKNGATIPQYGFENTFSLIHGRKPVVNRYFGPAHTEDNIVSILTSDGIMFGGCMFKAMNAGKGNLEDANTDEWANTIKKVMNAYPNVKFIIPGHGEPGSRALGIYTISLFSE